MCWWRAPSIDRHTPCRPLSSQCSSLSSMEFTGRARTTAPHRAVHCNSFALCLEDPTAASKMHPRTRSPHELAPITPCVLQAEHAWCCDGSRGGLRGPAMWRSGGNEAEVRIPSTQCALRVSRPPASHSRGAWSSRFLGRNARLSPFPRRSGAKHVLPLFRTARSLAHKLLASERSPAAPPPSPIPCGCSGGEGAVKAAMGGR